MNVVNQRMLCYANSLQSCRTLCDPIDGSPPGSPNPGILQARTLEWVAISYSMHERKSERIVRKKLSAFLVLEKYVHFRSAESWVIEGPLEVLLRWSIRQRHPFYSIPALGLKACQGGSVGKPVVSMRSCWQFICLAHTYFSLGKLHITFYLWKVKNSDSCFTYNTFLTSVVCGYFSSTQTVLWFSGH